MDNNLPGVYSGSTNSGKRFINFRSRNFGIIILIILAITIPIIVAMSQQQQDVRQRASEGDSVASVGNESISKAELEKAKGLFSSLDQKASNQAINQKALDFVIDRRLLQKEAEKRGVLSEAKEIANNRYNAYIAQYRPGQSSNGLSATNNDTLKNYFLNLVIKEKFESSVIKWRKVDYLSVRYLWHNNPGEEEIAFKNIAKNKIDEYYNKISNGLDIQEAIKKRCNDAVVNFLPFGDHIKIYNNTFDGKICREQRIEIIVNQDTNKEWGNKWLNEVFKLHKGDLSKVINFEEPATGLYFIIKVLDEGGEYSSISDLVTNLKAKEKVNIYAE
ncbi:MAG: SurA N-terminal domain-containing protein [Patescibacteria group bacterium]|nr:SurA N-terminal domain-containing protein [Patescibacteria group bacterium]